MFDSLGLVLGRISQIQQLTSQFQQVEQPAAPATPAAAQPAASTRVADDGSSSGGTAASGGAHRATTQGTFAEAFAAASSGSTTAGHGSAGSSTAASAARSTAHARAAAATAASASHTMTAPATSSAKPAAKAAAKVSTATGGFTPVTTSSDTVGAVSPAASYPALADVTGAGATTPPGIVAFDSATSQYYVTVGSQNVGGTIVPQAGAVSLSSPSSDTYALLQQLYAYQNNPGLLDQQVASGALGSASSLPKCFTDPTERAWTIIQLAADVVTSGPAYYGQYAGLSNAQVIQAYDLYTKNMQLNLNPVLAGALTRAYNVAKQDPSGGFSAPLTTDQLKSAVATITVVDAGAMGQVVESHLP